MWNYFALFFSLTMLIYLVNATQKLDITDIQQKDIRSKRCMFKQRSDSTNLINGDSPSLSKNKTKLFKKPMFFKYLLQRTAIETTFGKNYISLRRIRNIEDNKNGVVINTTILPLKNYSTINIRNKFFSENNIENITAREIDLNPLITTENIITTEEAVISIKHIDNSTLNTAFPVDVIFQNTFMTPAWFTDDELIHASTISFTLETDQEIVSEPAYTFFNNFNSNETFSDETSTQLTYTDIGITTKNFPNNKITNEPVYDQINTITSINVKNIKSMNLSTNNFLNVINNGNYENKEANNNVDNYSKIIMNSRTDITTIRNNTKSETSIKSNNSNTKSNKKYNFLVYNYSNIPCILVSMTIKLEFSYKTNYKSMNKKKVQVPNAAVVSGNCEKTKSYMTLAWIQGSAFNEQNNITFSILNDGISFYISNVQINIFLDNKYFPDAADVVLTGNSTTDLKLFSASVNNGVHICPSVTEVTCGEITALIKDVFLIAYNDKHNVSNKKGEYCSTPKNASIATIIGGIVGLAVIIAIITLYTWYRKKTITFRSELP